MGELASLAAAATWAVASVLFAQAGRRLGPTALNAVKCGLGTLILALLAGLGAGWTQMPSAAAWTWLGLSAAVGLAFGDSAYFGALNRLGPRRALLFWALVPPLTAVLGAGLLGEPITASMVLGMALTVGGVGWVVVERTPDPSLASGAGSLAELRWGVFLGLGAALGQALGNIWTKQGGEGLDTVQVSVIRLAFGSVLLVTQLLVTRSLGELARLTEPRLARQVVAGTVVGTAAGVYLMVYGLQHSYAAVAATLTATSPLFVLPLSVFVLKERLSVRAVIGAMLAVAGVGLLAFS